MYLEEPVMPPRWQTFVSDDSLSVSEPAPLGPLPTEAEALDAYSRVIVQVAETLRPAVVNLHSQGNRGGSGSGVLFTPDGFLLTNHHVVQGSASARVRLHDGGELDGRVVGT